MKYIHDGLAHLPHEHKGLRVDFLDAEGHRQRRYFQRQPLGLQLAEGPPVRVEDFAANSYGLERGVKRGWAVQRIDEEEVPESAGRQEVVELLEEHSANLPLWPLRADFEVSRGQFKAFYFENRVHDLEITTSPPFRIEASGSYAAACGVKPGWAIVRVGHLVVGRETEHDEVMRILLEGSDHLPEAQ